MAEVASAYVTLIPSARGFGAATSRQIAGEMDKAGRVGGEKLATGMKSRLGGLTRSVVAPLAGAFAAIKVADFFKGAVGEARESQKVGALTAQVIKSTGGAAHVTAAQVGGLATAISKKVGIDDEAIQSGENMLLTFKNIRNETGRGNDIFNRATSVTTDMAAAMAAANGGQIDLKSSAIQLGKALNDPIKGVSALSRVGVTFTDKQKAQIKTLVESGDTLGAQKVVLRELKSEFGGAAKSQVTNGKKMRVAFDNLKESIGTALIPVIDRLEGFLTEKLIPAMSATVGFLSKHSDVFKVVAAVIAGVLVPALIVWGVQSVIAAGKAVGSWLLAQASAVKSAAVQVFAVARIVAGWVLMGVQSLLAAAKVAAAWLIAMGPIALVIAAVVGLVILIIKYWDQIKAATVKVWNAIKAATSAAWNFIKDHLKTILEAIFVIVTGPIGLMVVLVARNWDKIKGATSAAWNAVKSTVSSIVSGIYGFVRDKFNALVSFFGGIPGRLASAASGMFDGIKDAFRSAINWIIDGWNRLEFSLPKVNTHIPGVGTIGGWSLGTPDIPRLASGGLITGSGLALVGENGPELLKLPRGARVIPNNEVSRSETALTVNNYYPKPEPASEATPRALREAAFTTGLAW